MPEQRTPTAPRPEQAVGACQFDAGRACRNRPFAVLTFEGPPVAGPGGEVFPGLRTMERHCQAHVDRRKSQVEAEGGSLVAVELLPSAPSVSDLVLATAQGEAAS